MQRQVSQVARDLYCRIDTSLNTVDDTKQAQCALSLANPQEVKEYFKWIAVPAGGGADHMYSLEDFKNYYASYPLPWQPLPDPMRNHANLKFMRTRMQRLLALDAKITDLPIVSITQEFKMKVAEELFGLKHDPGWEYDNKTTQELGILCGLTVLDNINGRQLIHKTFTTPLEAELYMKDKPNGSYLIRISTKGSEDGTGDCTVFTITFMYEGVPYHVRLLDMHGVGIYIATSGPNDDLPTADINYQDLLKKSNMRDVLRQVNYATPTYACLVDCLVDFEARGLIKLTSIIPV